MNWMKKMDRDLSVKFAKINLPQDRDLILEIKEFCDICETVKIKIDGIDLNIYDEANLIQTAWLFKLAFLSVNAEPVALHGLLLPGELLEELTHYGVGSELKFAASRSLESSAERALAISLMRLAGVDKSRSEVFRSVEFGTTLELRASTLEVGMAGYKETTRDERPIWLWRVTVRTGTGETARFILRDQELTSEIEVQLFGLALKAESEQDITALAWVA